VAECAVEGVDRDLFQSSDSIHGEAVLGFEEAVDRSVTGSLDRCFFMTKMTSTQSTRSGVTLFAAYSQIPAERTLNSCLSLSRSFTVRLRLTFGGQKKGTLFTIH